MAQPSLESLRDYSVVASPWRGNDYGKVRLIAGYDALERDGSTTIGVEIRLKKGWITYWRMPGASGLPPILAFDGSRNLSEHAVSWPTPERIWISGDSAVGYASTIVLPVKVDANNNLRPIVVSLDMQFAVCREMCVPTRVRLNLAVPVRNNGAFVRKTIHYRKIKQALESALDSSGADVGLRIKDVSLSRVGADRVLEIELEDSVPLKRPDAFVFAPHGVRFGAPEVRMKDGERACLVRLAVFEAEDQELAQGDELSIIIVDGSRRISTLKKIGSN